MKRRTPRLASASLVIAIGFAVLAALEITIGSNSPPNVLSVEDPHPNSVAYTRVAELIGFHGHTLVDARGPVD